MSLHLPTCAWGNMICVTLFVWINIEQWIRIIIGTEHHKYTSWWTNLWTNSGKMSTATFLCSVARWSVFYFSFVTMWESKSQLNVLKLIKLQTSAQRHPSHLSTYFNMYALHSMTRAVETYLHTVMCNSIPWLCNKSFLCESISPVPVDTVTANSTLWSFMRL